MTLGVFSLARGARCAPNEEHEELIPFQPLGRVLNDLWPRIHERELVLLAEEESSLKTTTYKDACKINVL